MQGLHFKEKCYEGSNSLGIDIGGTFIKYALMDKHYRKDKWKIETIKHLDTAAAFYDYICSNIKSLDEVEKNWYSAPGLIDADSNVKSYAAPNVSVMYGTNIKHRSQQKDKQKSSRNQ